MEKNIAPVWYNMRNLNKKNVTLPLPYNYPSLVFPSWEFHDLKIGASDIIYFNTYDATFFLEAIDIYDVQIHNVTANSSIFDTSFIKILGIASGSWLP